MSLYLFWGQEDYNIDVEIEKLKTQLLDSAFISMNYKIINTPEFIDIIDAIQTPPLMFGNMLSIINLEKFLIGNKFSIEDKQLNVLSQAIETIPESINIVFLCKISRDEHKKIDTRKKLYKIIAKHAQVKEFPQFRSYQKELPAYIQKMAKEKEISIDLNTATYIVEQMGVNLRLINSELEKLKVAIHPKKQAKKEDIKQICVSCDDLFSLADFIATGDKNKTVEQFKKLTERRHELEILSVLQSSIQKFIFIKNYEKLASDKEIATKLNMNEYIVKLTKEKLASVQLSKMISIKNNLTRAEYQYKSGKITPPELAIEIALLS